MFIPKKIRVGYQERSDTYTKQLAYVIYYDEKNKIRKQASWESWRSKAIEPNDFDNTPTSGFVLNKKVGGYKSDWNFRSAYVRIYDPRNFEFEITIENLLFILENTSSIKGKGLEGDFVYGWNGSDLMLIPTGCPDYQKISAYSDMITNPEKFSKDTMIVGATYKTNKDDNLIYLGRFHKYLYKDYYYHPEKDKTGDDLGMHYYFIHEGSTNSFETYKSLGGKIVKLVDATVVNNFAELFDQLEAQTMYSPVNEEATIIEPITWEYFDSKLMHSNYWSIGPFYSMINGKPELIQISTNGYSYNDRRYSSYNYSPIQFTRLDSRQLFDKLQPVAVRKFLMTGKEIKVYGN